MDNRHYLITLAFFLLCGLTYSQNSPCGYRSSDWEISAEIPGIGVKFKNKKTRKEVLVDQNYFKCIQVTTNKICSLEEIKNRLSQDQKSQLKNLYNELAQQILDFGDKKREDKWIEVDPTTGKKFSQTFTINSRDYCNPCDNYNFSKSFELDRRAQITCVSYWVESGPSAWSTNPLEDQLNSNCKDCKEADRNKCNRSERPNGPWCAGADQRCQYCINYRIDEPGNSFTAYRNWGFGDKILIEKYTVYYKVKEDFNPCGD